MLLLLYSAHIIVLYGLVESVELCIGQQTDPIQPCMKNGLFTILMVEPVNRGHTGGYQLYHNLL